MTLEGLSSVCAKSEPASFKNNEILEINVLQKFTSHALHGQSHEYDVSSFTLRQVSTEPLIFQIIKISYSTSVTQNTSTSFQRAQNCF